MVRRSRRNFHKNKTKEKELSKKRRAVTKKTIITCGRCNGYGTTFGATSSLTCIDCGGSGLLEIHHGSGLPIRKVPKPEVQSYCWRDVDYNGEPRINSLRKNKVKIRDSTNSVESNSVEDLLDELESQHEEET